MASTFYVQPLVRSPQLVACSQPGGVDEQVSFLDPVPLNGRFAKVPKAVTFCSGRST